MEKEFLLKLAVAYQTYDASVIEAYLAEDMHYASMWVFQELTSKSEYIDYLKGKLATMKAHHAVFDFEIVPGRMHKNALLASRDNPVGGCGFVVDFDENNKVKMINMTAPAFF